MDERMPGHEVANRIRKLIEELDLMERFEKQVTTDDDCYVIGCKARQLRRAETAKELNSIFRQHTIT